MQIEFKLERRISALSENLRLHKGAERGYLG